MKYGEHLKANIAPEYGAENYLQYERMNEIITELSQTKPSRYVRGGGRVTLDFPNVSFSSGCVVRMGKMRLRTLFSPFCVPFRHANRAVTLLYSFLSCDPSHPRNYSPMIFIIQSRRNESCLVHDGSPANQRSGSRHFQSTHYPGNILDAGR